VQHAAADQTQPPAAKRHRPQRIQERACFIRHLEVAAIDVTSIRSRSELNGPARAIMPRFPEGWMAMGLLDGLATTIRFRLSSHGGEGAWAGLDAMAVGVVFAGLVCPVDVLPTLIRVAAACPSAGPDAMLVGVVFMANPAITSGPQYRLGSQRVSAAVRPGSCWQCLQAMKRREWTMS
jgi:hypothetical protein